jgi:gliding motility-associated-like protein
MLNFFWQGNHCYGQCSNINFKASTTKGCALLLVQFNATGTSSATGTTFQWDFGSGMVSGKDTITKAFPNAGKYTVIMKATLTGGTVCTVKKDTFITVLANPVPVMYISSGLKICNRALTNIIFIDSTPSSRSRQWIIEGNNFKTKTLNYNFATAGSQHVTLQATNTNGCTNTIDKVIRVYDSIPLDFCGSFTDIPTQVTGKFNPIVPNIGGRVILSYKWNFPGGSPATSASSNPTVTYPDPSRYYNVYLTITMADGCSYTIGRQAFVSPFLSPAFKKWCVNEPIDFNGDLFDTTRHQYNFTFHNANLVKLIPPTSPDPNHGKVLYTKTGDYDATVSYRVTGLGCRVTAYYPVFATMQGPVADFDSKDRNLCDPLDTLHLRNTSDVLGAPDVQYTWYIFDSLDHLLKKRFKLGPTSSRDTFYVPGKWGFYGVRLVAKSPNGCTDSMYHKGFISVAKPTISILKSKPYCFGNAVQIFPVITPASGKDEFKFRWRFWNVADSTDSVSSEAGTPFFYQLLLGTYNARVYISNGKCNSSSTGDSVVTVYGDNADFSVSKNSGCLDPDFTTTCSVSREKYFPNDPAHPPQYHWRVEDLYKGSVTFKSPFSKTTQVVFNKPGCYDIMLDIITVLGKDTCRQEITKYNMVCVGLQTYFEPMKLKCKEDTIVINNYSDSDARFLKWTILPKNLSTIIPSDTDRNISIIFHKDTCYSVKLVASKFVDGVLCKDSTIDTICIGPPLPGFYTTTPKLFCAPAISKFQSTTTTAKAAYYTWNFGDGDSLTTTSDTIINHVYQQFNKISYDISLRAFDKFGCSNVLTRKGLINVTGPVPLFTVDKQKGCDSITVNFTNTSSKVNQFIFLYDDGSAPLINTNPGPHVYKLQDSTLDTFVFNPTLISRDDSLCKGFHQEKISLYRTPVNTRIIADHNSGCVPLTVHFQSFSRAAKSWYWDFEGTGKVSSTLKNPVYTFTKPGKYRVKLAATNDLCSETVYSDSIIVSGNAKAGFNSYPTRICDRQQVYFKNTSSGYGSFIFDYGDGSLKDTNRIMVHNYFYDPVKNKGDSVVFHPKIIVYNTGGCTDTFQSVITVYRLPAAGFTSSAQSGCSPLKISFTDTSRHGFAAEWDFDNDGITDAYGRLVQWTFSPGVYSVKLRSISVKGCVDSVLKVNLISVNNPPKADFSVSDSDICYGGKIKFKNLTYPDQEVVRWKWKFNDTSAVSDTSGARDPEFGFYKKGLHPISLFAIDNKGCKDSITKQAVFVEDTLNPKTSTLYNVTVLDTHSVKITWQKSKERLFKAYKVNRLLNGNAVPLTRLTDLNDTSYVNNDLNTNTSQQSYCYSIQVINKCDRLSFASYSHCTILLHGLAGTGNSNTLNWSSYIGWGPKYYRIYRAADNGQNKILDSVPGNVLTYTDTSLCDENYTYLLEAVGDSGYMDSKSNKVSIGRHYIYQAKQVDLRYVTVENNAHVKMQWDTINYSGLKGYLIDKYVSGNWLNSYAFTTDNVYADMHTGINDSSYIYKVSTIDRCGYLGPVSNDGSSILLRANVNHDHITLKWNAYRKWPAGVKNYRIQVRVKPGMYSNIASVKDTVYQDDSVYIYIDTAYCYRVIACENGINKDSSVSNLSCAVLPSRIFVPNAFTPMGDSLNDVWKVSALSIYNAIGKNVKGFDLKIYNRWGTLVFQTKDLHQGWDGTFRGQKSPVDVYIYMIDAQGIDDRELHLSGNLTLLRR